MWRRFRCGHDGRHVDGKRRKGFGRSRLACLRGLVGRRARLSEFFLFLACALQGIEKQTHDQGRTVGGLP
ncbi:MAG: hypothetical protein FD157_4074 [Rhodocyclaceae bacterium]|nr:MAG: hypothetical protein FD157_4074 [Rhodocyclaceae bacterium]TNC98004.1 MAG: hypothetical protein FD118_4073 [Rhodocyclaceae bacterium]